ncbi:MAG: hypothetical protein FJY92_08065 [Candidatus Hydrogenedentes bacterium]|nr:hypothetical protein [Candidatus Hydrogenedentota bacterium]
MKNAIVRRSAVLIAAWAAAFVCGCATTKAPNPVDLGALEPVREMGGGVAGPWTPLDGGVTNLVPAEGAIAEGQVRDGTGISTGLVKGFSARDLSIEANVNYSGNGAPGLVFRVQEKDGEITAMYAATLFAAGVNVWRFSEGRWMLLLTQNGEFAPRASHSLRVEARRDSIQVYADGQRMAEVQDDGLLEGGRVGIRALEGPCKISGLRIAKG